MYVRKVHPELKYDNSSPMAFMGFARLEKSEITPKLTSIFRNRPSHIRETSYDKNKMRACSTISRINTQIHIIRGGPSFYNAMYIVLRLQNGRRGRVVILGIRERRGTSHPPLSTHCPLTFIAVGIEVESGG